MEDTMITIQIKEETVALLAKAIRDEVTRRRDAARPFINDSSPAAQLRRRAAALLEEVGEAVELAAHR
jgi:hypothetical protein